MQHRIGDPDRAARRPSSPSRCCSSTRPGAERWPPSSSDDGIRQRVSELRRQLSTPQGMALKELARLDPLGLAEVFLGRLETSRGTLNVDWTSGYYLSRDHRLLLILAEPVKPPQDIPFNERPGRRTSTARSRRASRDWGEIAGPEAAAEAGGRARRAAPDGGGRRGADPQRHDDQHRHLGAGGLPPLPLRLPAGRERCSTPSCRCSAAWC